MYNIRALIRGFIILIRGLIRGFIKLIRGSHFFLKFPKLSKFSKYTKISQKYYYYQKNTKTYKTYKTYKNIQKPYKNPTKTVQKPYKNPTKHGPKARGSRQRPWARGGRGIVCSAALFALKRSEHRELAKTRDPWKDKWIIIIITIIIII